MSNIPNEADRLHAASRNKILLASLRFGLPLLVITVFASLHYVGTIDLAEYFAEDPNKIDRDTLWLCIGGMALFLFLGLAISVNQGWAGIRRANHMRKQ